MYIKRLAIIGTVGLPANYGGFETLVDNLVQFHSKHACPEHVTVYCSSKTYPDKPSSYLTAQLKYIALNANGAQSILYDVMSLVSAVWHRNDVILLLGVSGAIALPIVRFLSSARIITNIDGIEWRREKWQGIAKSFLRFSEKMAVKFSHDVISDNAAIAEYVMETYGVDSHVIAYGGDHTVSVETKPVSEYELPQKYSFSVCRIEPENNVHLILQAFAQVENRSLVMVGNWNNSQYGQVLREKYAIHRHIVLLDPIYDLGKLKTLRSNMTFYVHGHSAGGTNPSLVEAMHFGKPILAFECDFNYCTTEGRATYFKDSEGLVGLLLITDTKKYKQVGMDMMEIAKRRYHWDGIAKQYLNLIRVSG